MFLKSNDAEILISSYGSGNRMFVAHGGFVGSGELWSFTFETLSRSWRSVTYDHRGSGGTRHGAQEITFELLVSDLFRVLDALRIESCVLAGESMGTVVVLEAALRHPERFSGLVLVGGFFSGTRTPGKDDLIKGCKVNFPATMDTFVNRCMPEQNCEAERAWGKQIVNRSNGPSAVQLLECTYNINLESRLASIKLPTLLLHGNLDVVVPLASAERMATLIPNAKLAIAEGAGHVPIVTRPQWVAEQINDFFSLNNQNI